MNLAIKAWHYPNVLGIDAAVIAVVWQILVAIEQGVSLSYSAHWVLGLSVWLTYMADRLYDVSKHDPQQLLSLRHSLAKRHRKTLWSFWFAVLSINAAIAFLGLDSQQLLNGFALLSACLTYTLLNQLLSKRFFPKEMLVALIFAGGVIGFIDPLPNVSVFLIFAAACFLNCICIGQKEVAIDQALRVHSLAMKLNPWFTFSFSLISTLICLWLNTTLAWGVAIVLTATSLLYFYKSRIETECYRVLVDSSLLLGALPFALS
ncbi:MAG: hypothetical protein ACON4O_07185 [Lentimonas sp.]